MPDHATGGCLCGGVRYEALASLRDVVACHCGQCRRWHGHVGAYTAVAKAKFRVVEGRSLKWFSSSSFARRGFCSECGSSLFWERIGGDQVSIAAGTLDPPTNLSLTKHIFVGDQGDYYAISDGLPQRAKGLP